MTVALSIVTVAGAAVALAWSLLAIRLIRLARGPWFRFLPPADLGATPSSSPTVAAIVPARNEEAHVAATVEALRRQDYSGLTITVVDDESTDATLPLLHRLADQPTEGLAPLTVVAGTPRPDRWVGKTWAVHQGADAATAEWLWFVDADMGLHPRALTSALLEAERAGADFVSLLPGVRCTTFWQRTVIASFLHILAHLYPLDRVNDPGRHTAFAAGGFVLVRRGTYERAGGHRAVRHAIVDDIELARLVKRSGGRLVVRLAPGLAWTHMYGSFGAIWVGLRKNAYAGMDYMPHKYAVGAMVALALGWMPWLTLGFGLARRQAGPVAVGASGILAQVAATLPNLVFLGAAPAYALALPLGITAYVAIATASAWHYHRGRVVWKGRAIPAATVTPAATRDDARNQHGPKPGRTARERR